MTSRDRTPRAALAATALASFVALAATPATAGCSTARMVDFAMQSAKRPVDHRGMRVGDREILAGDLHCHVLPPDSPWHVARDLDETLALAAREKLDFVVLTPHVPKRFFADPELRAWVLATQDELAARVARARPSAIVVPGFEYTDHAFGHVGVAFADVREVLAGLSLDEAQGHPARFFERWIAAGGLLTINHPVERPLRNAPFSALRHDLTWRAFTRADVPGEIAFVTTHAQSIEVFNASITHLRDQFILGDEERSIREASALVDRTARAQERRVAPVGGSDSHGDWLRATTFVLAKARTREAIRDAIVEGRTCVRGPEGCTLEVAAGAGGGAGTGAADPAFHGVGEAVSADGFVSARARGGDVTFLVDDVIAGHADDGVIATLPVPRGRCALVRAVVGPSFSAPVYVNCSFATAAAAGASVDGLER